EELFNPRNELSGIILLDKTQLVCESQKEVGGAFVLATLRLGQLMLEGAKKFQNDAADPACLGPFSAVWFPAGAGHNFINLNQYLTTNRLRAVDHDKLDLRTVNQYFEWWIADPTPEGVKKILTVGAPQ